MRKIKKILTSIIMLIMLIGVFSGASWKILWAGLELAVLHIEHNAVVAETQYTHKINQHYAAIEAAREEYYSSEDKVINWFSNMCQLKKVIVSLLNLGGLLQMFTIIFEKEKQKR